MRCSQIDCRETYENVDDPGDRDSLAAEQHADIPLKDTDQKPIQTRDYQEDERHDV